MSSYPALPTFLAEKPLYYSVIDHRRIYAAYARLKPHIRHPKTVHIVGTNGKGSTGRIMAHLASRAPASLSVGHFSSPHILSFNERIWLNGHDASDAILETAHRKLLDAIGVAAAEGLSYFEYTTLLALVVFEHCDVMVLEAGLGGEYDATNVCDKDLSVVTPIGIDHQSFLGDTVAAIAATKIRSIRHTALLAPQPDPEVVEIARTIAQEKRADLWVMEAEVSAAHHPKLSAIAHAKGWPDYLRANAGVAMKALDIMGIPYAVGALSSLVLFGRFYPLTDRIRIDVGHNPLAARAIVEAMKPNTVLIYHALQDKDIATVLRILKPKIQRIEIIPITTPRAAPRAVIESAAADLGLPWRSFDGTMHAHEHYVVFGSFYTVEAFLKTWKRTPHAAQETL